MKELLNYILSELTGSNDFSITESVEGEHFHYEISLPQEQMGIIIGKEGRTIKAIRNLLKVKATLEKKGVSLNISETSPEA